MATEVPAGTVSSVGTFNPTVDLSSDPSSYSAMHGGTLELSGNGGFSGIGGTTGTLNGTLLFSDTVGQTLSEQLSDFFVFDDTKGGTYNFSIDTVTTKAFVNETGDSSGTLLLIGDILDDKLGYSATNAALSIQFNNTGGSDYSSALTLVVPTPSVPEPATWALTLAGFATVGCAMRRRKAVDLAVA